MPHNPFRNRGDKFMPINPAMLVPAAINALNPLEALVQLSRNKQIHEERLAEIKAEIKKIHKSAALFKRQLKAHQRIALRKLANEQKWRRDAIAEVHQHLTRIDESIGHSRGTLERTLADFRAQGNIEAQYGILREYWGFVNHQTELAVRSLSEMLGKTGPSRLGGGHHGALPAPDLDE